MSKLDELIKELCPDGVEYKKIKDVYTRLRGTPITASKMKEIENPNGDIRIFAGGKNAINAFANDIPNLNVVDKPAVLVQSRGIIDFIYYERPFTFKNEMWAYTNEDKVSVKFLYYVLKNNALHFRELASGMGSLPQISLRVTEEFRVPVPPLEVQSEIVKILDNFTELTAELIAELTARKKQYEYYRNRLLTFDTASHIKKVKLGDVAKVTKLAGFEFTKYVTYVEKGHIIALRGLNVKNGNLDLCDVKYIDGSDLSKLERSKLHVGDMLFTYVGTIGQVALIDKEDTYYLAPNVALIRADKNVLLPEYMRFYFQSSLFWDTQIKRLLQSSSMKNIPMEKIRKFELLVPPIDVQRRLVHVLDNFDKVCNDLHIGLPAEIEARKKQYEFYRDSLLTFLEKGESILTDRQTELKYALIKLLQYVFGYVIFPISTVGKVLMCKRIFKEQTMPIGDVPFYKIGTFGGQADAYIDENLYHEYKNKYSFPLKGEILISCSGTIGRCIIYDGEPAYFQDSNIVWVSNDESIVLNKFLYYLYKTMSWNIVSGGTIGRLYKSDIEKTLIKVPPKDKQVKIVSILERFDTLCHDISSGLPAEIEARKKQYEYYRDKLLSFKEKKG